MYNIFSYHINPTDIMLFVIIMLGEYVFFIEAYELVGEQDSAEKRIKFAFILSIVQLIGVGVWVWLDS